MRNKKEDHNKEDYNEPKPYVCAKIVNHFQQWSAAQEVNMTLVYKFKLTCIERT